MGEVKDPGIYGVPRGGIDILTAISAAGGFTNHAGRSGAVVVRSNRTGYQVIEVDLSAFEDVASSQIALVALEAYDIVYVPKSGMGKFAYFSETVIAGLAQLARVAADVKYLTGVTGLARY